ncbi:MAG: 30S ribosomal protein S20 [Pseudomonadota bacterium]
MAHTVQARKRIRQNLVRKENNRPHITRLGSFMRKVEEAISEGDYEKARAAFSAAMPVLQSGASKGYMHRNTVARRLSRYSRKIKALKA